MKKQPQDGNTSQLSLDARFSSNTRRASVAPRHQSQDCGMNHPSLNQRFGGGQGEQLLMTALCCRGVQTSIMGQQPLDQRFSGDHSRSPMMKCHHLTTAVEQRNNGDSLQRPTAPATSVGQQEQEPTVMAFDSYTEHQQLSTYTSTGAQPRNADKAGESETELKSAANDGEATTSRGIGSTESRPVALRWPLDYHETDRPSSLYDGMVGQRSSPLAVSPTQGGSSEDHPSTESPGGRERSEAYRQVNQNGCSMEEEVACQPDPPHRHSYPQR